MFSMASEQEITAYSPVQPDGGLDSIREHLGLSASVAKHGIHNAGTIKRYIYIIYWTVCLLPFDFFVSALKTDLPM